MMSFVLDMLSWGVLGDIEVKPSRGQLGISRGPLRERSGFEIQI